MISPGKSRIVWDDKFRIVRDKSVKVQDKSMMISLGSSGKVWDSLG